MITLFRKNSYRWSVLAIILFLLAGCAALTNGNAKKPAIKEEQNSAEEAAISPVKVENPWNDNIQEDNQYGFTVDGNHITGKIPGIPDAFIQDCVVDADIKPFPSTGMKTYKIPSTIISFDDFKKKIVPAVLPQGQNIQNYTFKDGSFTDAVDHSVKTIMYSASKGNAGVTYYTTQILYGNRAKGEILATEGVPGTDEQNIPGYKMTNDQARSLADAYVSGVVEKLGWDWKLEYDETTVCIYSPGLTGENSPTQNYRIQYAMDIDGVNTETDTYSHLSPGLADNNNDGKYEIMNGYGLTQSYGILQVTITDKGIQEVMIRIPDNIQEVENKPVISPEAALQGLIDIHLEYLDQSPQKITGIEPVYLAVETGFDENMNKDFQLTPYWRIMNDGLPIYVNAYTGVPISFRLAAPEGFAPAEE